MDDLFISHASEDKESFVRPLVDRLIAAGYSVWYDELRMQPGASIRESVDCGLTRCKKCIVVVSPHYLRKPWTRHELNGLFALQMNGESKIIPIWYGVMQEEVLQVSPPLADLFALRSESGIETIIESLLAIIEPSRKGGVRPRITFEDAVRIERSAKSAVWVASNLVYGGPWLESMSFNLLRNPPVRYRYVCPRFTEAPELAADIAEAMRKFVTEYKIPAATLLRFVEITSHYVAPPIEFWVIDPYEDSSRGFVTLADYRETFGLTFSEVTSAQLKPLLAWFDSMFPEVRDLGTGEMPEWVEQLNLQLFFHDAKGA